MGLTDENLTVPYKSVFKQVSVTLDTINITIWWQFPAQWLLLKYCAGAGITVL